MTIEEGFEKIRGVIAEIDGDEGEVLNKLIDELSGWSMSLYELEDNEE